MELELATRRRVTAAMVNTNPKATKTEKAQLLDQLCAVTGWHRDHARKAMRAAMSGQPPPARRPREPVWTHGPKVIEALRRAWRCSTARPGNGSVVVTAEAPRRLSTHITEARRRGVPEPADVMRPPRLPHQNPS